VDYLNILLKVFLSLWLFFCSWQDIKRQEISIFLISLGFISLLVISLLNGDLSLVERVAGILVGLVLLMLNRITRGQIGIGDGLIFCVTGISLGFFLNSILLLYSLIISAIFSGFYMIVKRVGKKTTIPFVPFVFIVSLGVFFIE